MPISSTTNRRLFTGNGVTTVFPFQYYFLNASDLVVIKTEIASGAATTLALNVDYTVTGAGDPNGGNVTLTTAPSSAYKLTIYRDPPLTQQVDFQSNDSLPDEQLEEPVDKLTMIAQRLKEMLLRAVRLADSDVSGADVTLPSPEASKAIRWKNDASGLENYTVVIPTGAVSTATTTSEGIVELATQAEVNTGTDAQRAVTPSTLANGTLAGRVTTAETNINTLLASAGSDNIIINSGMQVNQRRVTTGAADDTYTLDRWNLLTQTSTVTIAQQTAQSNTIPYNIRITQAQATAQRVGIEQIIESENCVFLHGQQVVFGAKVRCSSSQAIRYALLEWTGSVDSVTSDVVNDWTSASYTTGNFFLASNLTVVATGSVTPAANTWTQLPGLSATLSAVFNNLVLVVWSEGTLAQNVTLDVSQVQVHPGATLPTYRQENRTVETLKCYRYYQKTFDYTTQPAQNVGAVTGSIRGMQVVAASTASTGGIAHRFLAPMQRTPTVTLYNPFAANAQARNTTISADCTLTSEVSTNGFQTTIQFTSPAASAAGNAIAVHATFEAEL